MGISQGGDKSSERVVRLLLDLQSGRSWNPVQLAQELSVSRRTIFRDIATLRRAGVPIQFDEQQNSYRLIQASGKSAAPLSPVEIIVLTLAARLSPLDAAEALSIVIKEGVSKLVDRLSDEGRDKLATLSSTCANVKPQVLDTKHLHCIEAVIGAAREPETAAAV